MTPATTPAPSLTTNTQITTTTTTNTNALQTTNNFNNHQHNNNNNHSQPSGGGSELASISEQPIVAGNHHHNNNNHHHHPIKPEALPKAPIATPELIGSGSGGSNKTTSSTGGGAGGVKGANDVNKENIPTNTTTTATTTAASRFQKTAAQTAPYIELNNVPINGTSPTAQINNNNNSGVPLDNAQIKNQVCKCSFFFKFKLQSRKIRNIKLSFKISFLGQI